ncbi:4-amino-4-deoxychorismate lyase [Alcanivorax xiamenensis]|uniref:Aminodeoxychorismate lyase n=1 Tax=Alcanivorax xiamenensis TaxID=1177156 RepID=A0ABQ6Y2L1_9GAMM|nr:MULTISPECIES: aminodeoxychorismate lyase [Alcanivorax]KAF0802165.1 4-amino-4-deoxychorismate lyase [Alcanivorax xiamenensis]
MLSRSDRGLAYGDGLFETLRVSADGRVPLWPRHRARMLAGARRLAIPLTEDRLERTLAARLRDHDGGAGVIKLVLTRGSGGRGYLPPERPQPTLFGQWFPFTEEPCAHLRHGVEIGLCDTVLPDDPLAGLKHLNRLPQVVARAEAGRRGWREGLLLDRHRCPVEATSMNLFAVFGDLLWTPSLERAGVAGVARGWLLDVARDQGWRVEVRARPLSHLRRADGIFLTNSIVGLLPVRKLAQWTWPVDPQVPQWQRLWQARFNH